MRDLRAQYGATHRIVRASSGNAALKLLADLTLRDRSVALVFSDERMPGMTGIELLAEVCQQSPGTKLVLLTGPAR